ncbi:hypothetical protein LPUS_06434 [Lasallia pustulata]|uniref:Uncharacterized protein n=1 Tax=Lasallia pustulata TaxID=136370 RepID=A0A1W5D131_9LECA|nr:hypothetical protein LPUS_06434 [Lasallia pustulata]
MALIHAPRRESRHKPLSASKAVEKLINTSKLIEYREDVRPQEAKRIQDAFTLMAEPSGEGRASQAAERRNNYRWLLKKVQDTVGPQLVVLCAVGLGQSAIGGMTDRVRLEFLEVIKEQEEALKSAILQKLANEYSVLAPDIQADAMSTRQPEASEEHLPKAGPLEDPGHAAGSLAGDVYKLTIEDLQTLATSNQIQGQILLTDPYKPNYSPFITILISKDLRNHFATQSVQIM